MLVVQEQLKYCANCERQTLHQRNNKQMSWLMHLVLTIFTFGVWLAIWALIALWHILTKPIGGRWICSVCGEKESATPTIDRIGRAVGQLGEPAKLEQDQRQATMRVQPVASVRTPEPRPIEKSAPKPESRVVHPSPPAPPRPLIKTGDQPPRCPACNRLAVVGQAGCSHCGAAFIS